MVSPQGSFSRFGHLKTKMTAINNPTVLLCPNIGCGKKLGEFNKGIYITTCPRCKMVVRFDGEIGKVLGDIWPLDKRDRKLLE